MALSPVPTAPVTRAISTGLPPTTVAITPTGTPSPSPIPTASPPTATPSPLPPIATPAPVAPLALTVRWLHNAWDIVWDLDAGDLDGDGVQEIIVAAQDRKVHVLEPDGALRWQYEAQAGVYAVDVADLDGDGPPEVVIIGVQPSRIESGTGLSSELKKTIPQIIRIIHDELDT